MRMFCFLLDFQVNYGKLLWFLKAAASDDPPQSKEAAGSNQRKSQGCHHHGQRFFLSFLGHSAPRLLEQVIIFQVISPNVESLCPSPTAILCLSFPFSRAQASTEICLQQLHRFLEIKHVSYFNEVAMWQWKPSWNKKWSYTDAELQSIKCDYKTMFSQWTPGLQALAKKGFRYQNQ